MAQQVYNNPLDCYECYRSNSKSTNSAESNTTECQTCASLQISSSDGASEFILDCYYCKMQRILGPVRVNQPEQTSFAGSYQPISCFVCGSNLNCSKTSSGQVRCRLCRSFEYGREKNLVQIPRGESCSGGIVGGCQMAEEDRQRASSYCSYEKCCAETSSTIAGKNSCSNRRKQSLLQETSGKRSKSKCCICGGEKNTQVSSRNGSIQCSSCKIFMGMRKKMDPNRMTLDDCLGNKQGKCVITENNRKCCYCRFQKGIALESSIARRTRIATSCFVCNSVSRISFRWELGITLCEACNNFWLKQKGQNAPEHTISSCIGYLKKGNCTLIAPNYMCRYCRYQKILLAKRTHESYQSQQQQLLKTNINKTISEQQLSCATFSGVEQRQVEVQALPVDSIDSLQQSKSARVANEHQSFFSVNNRLATNRLLNNETSQVSDKMRHVQVGNLALCQNKVLTEQPVDETSSETIQPLSMIFYQVESSKELTKKLQEDKLEQNPRVRMQQIVIDRRPLLKKVRRITTQNSKESSKHSLIGFGEDCDDSSDNEIIEIDCDT